MKKDIEWLKEEILGLRKNGNTESNQTEVEKEMGRLQKWAWDNCADRVYELINQLDEPEVLSQELPVIPKFVAEWYESEGKRSSWWNWFYKWGRDESRSELETKTIRWMQDFNEEKFVDIFKHGYKMEEEQKYTVSSPKVVSGFWFLSKNNDGEVVIGTNKDYFDYGWDALKLTEQEIKDCDERYWPFAVKVEELEE